MNMKVGCMILLLMFAGFGGQGQTIGQKLEDAAKKLSADSQMQHAIAGFYVADAKTGKEIYNLNGNILLTPASTQKIITSIAALDVLGKDYKYKTELGYDGELNDDKLQGNLFIKGYGDPTLGSRRYKSTHAEAVLAGWMNHLKKSGIKKITGNVYLDASAFSFQPLPGGWIWEDMGNYYGAGTWGINWNENQYELLLKPGSHPGDKIAIKGTEPELKDQLFVNNLVTGGKGSGDNAYIYNPPFSKYAFVEGSFEGGSKICGAISNPPRHLAFELEKLFYQNNIMLDGSFITSEELVAAHKIIPSPAEVFYTHYSPAMDSIVYWFMKKSINVYGEALLKSIALAKTAVGATDSGVAVAKRFYTEKAIASAAELKIVDGSGLSPQNRLTPKSLVNALLYAQQQAWFNVFYQSFPENNNMKLKSGTLSGVKSFAGYHTAADGREYVLAIIVNSYQGATSSLVKKIYKLLDVLK